MEQTIFQINKMDCPCEEQMIRMKLAELTSVQILQFDIPNRKLRIFHQGPVDRIEHAIHELNLDSRRIQTVTVENREIDAPVENEKSVLVSVLFINFILFLIELTTGFFSKSMGLIADSLDMLADAIVYGLSLYAVGGAVSKKKKIAKISGYFQFTLAAVGFGEVIRRFLGFEAVPVFQTMIMVSVIALLGNTASLMLLRKTKDSGVHMKASWIFTSNDVIANIGVILAGVMVHFTGSNKPDLIIGGVVFFWVARGAFRIYNLSK